MALYTERLSQWMQANPWFETDPARRQVASDIALELEAAGNDPDSDEYFREIDRLLEAGYEPVPTAPAGDVEVTLIGLSEMPS